tara:strand:+ start:607 stop:762 length:156 start_codon:yes stop_codon:yes gene_type:complete
MSKESRMSDKFHDWLDQCPVGWHRIQHDETGASYKFLEDDEDRASETSEDE